MSRTFTLMLVCVSITLLSLTPSPGNTPGSAAEKPGASRRGEALAVTVEKGPEIDGTMSDPLWQKCRRWPMGACTSDDPQKYETYAKVLFDATHVYVGVFCEEPDTRGMAIRGAKHDDPVWDGDSVEVFLRPDPHRPCSQFVVNPRGVIYDARDKQPSFDATAEAKTSIDQRKAWTVVLKIPLGDLPAYVGEDQVWTMNVYRTRPARGDDETLMYSWSVMREADYHAVSEFGVVAGIDIPKRADGVTRVLAGGAQRPAAPNRGREIGGVTVYQRISFNASAGGFRPGEGTEAGPTDDAVDRKAFRVECRKGWAGCELPISIVGSRELKVALMIDGRNMESAGINVYDTLARDNTTAYGYRRLKGDWTPAVYFLDKFRYNSRDTGFVSPNTHYASVRFYGPQQVPPGAWFAMDNFVIYRGDDRLAPAKVTGLEALATGRGVQLKWDAADDNVAPMVYVVSRADRGGLRKIAESHRTSYLDTAAPTGRCRYRVFAIDFEENLGPWSDPVAVNSTSPPQQPALSREGKDRLGYADHVRRVHTRGKGKVRRNHVTLFGDSLTGATVYPQCARAAFGNQTVHAFGYAAQRTSFARNKVREIIEKENPEFMFILYGTNNNKAQQSIPAAMDDLTAVVGACEANGTVAVLGTIPPRGWKSESGPEANFNKHLIGLCRKLEIPTGYIFEGFQAKGSENRRTYMGGDGVHWTGEGMAIGGCAWGETLDQVRFVLRDQE